MRPAPFVVPRACPCLVEEREFVTIKCLGQSRPIVFETSRVEAAQKRIIEKYNVIKDHYLGEEDEPAATRAGDATGSAE